MNPNTVKTLGAVTLLFGAGAWYANASRNAGAGTTGAGEAALPALRERINDVASMVIETKDGTATLERSGDGWGLAEKGGYPAKEPKVREVLMGLRGALVIEQKTADPEKLPRLGLTEPSEEGSSAKRVTIKDAAGKDIASVLIGDRRAAKGGFDQRGGAPKGQTYIHVEEGSPALLVDGQFMLDTRTATWLDQALLNVPATRMKAVRVRHSDDEVLELSRRDMADSDFEILSVPEGMEPKSPSATRSFMSTLSGLRFDDVRKAETFEWPEGNAATAEYFTEHGLRVAIRSAEISDENGAAKTWCTIEVDVVDPGSLPGAEQELTETGPPAPTDLGAEADGATEAGELEPEGPSQEELEKEAASIRATVDGWVFALPSWKAGPVRMRLDGVLQEIPAPEPETADEAAESADEPDAEGAADGENG